MRLRRNKRGLMDDWMDFVISVVILVIVFIFISSFSGMKQADAMNKIEEASVNNKGMYDLLVFLRSQEGTGSMGDYIITAVADRDIDLDTIDDKVRDYFNTLYLSRDTNWALFIIEVESDGDTDTLRRIYGLQGQKAGSNIKCLDGGLKKEIIGQAHLPYMDKEEKTIAIRVDLQYCTRR